MEKPGNAISYIQRVDSFAKRLNDPSEIASYNTSRTRGRMGNVEGVDWIQGNCLDTDAHLPFTRLRDRDFGHNSL